MSSAWDLIVEARQAGLDLWVDGDKLRFRAHGSPPEALLVKLRAHRGEIVGRLRALESMDAAPTRISARPPSAPRVLSANQRRLWDMERREGLDGSFHVPLILRLRGQLDGSALVAALDALAARHEVLRTVTRTVDGAPRPELRTSAHLVPDQRDLTTRTPEQVAGEVLGFFQRPFDLANEIPVRAMLAQLGPREWLLSVVVHHIAFDGGSASLCLSELEALYCAYRDGRPPEVEPVRLQYADFAEWERVASGGEPFLRKVENWRRLLSDAPDGATFPLDRPRQRPPSHRGGVLAQPLRGEADEALAQLASDSRSTTFSVLLASLALLLSRWSGSDDIVLGTVASGRDRPELRSMVGYLTDTFLIRIRIDEGRSVAEFLEQVRRINLDALANQGVSLSQIADPDSASVGDGPSRALFRIGLTFRPELEERTFADLEIAPYPFATGTAKCDQCWNFVAGRNGVRCAIEYCGDLYDESSVCRHWDGFQSLLVRMAKSLDCLLGDLPVPDARGNSATVGDALEGS